MGFKFQIVLADSLYGESGDFIEALNHNQLKFVVAIRSNHSVWCRRASSIHHVEKFDRVFSNGDTEVRYIREIVLANETSDQITTDKVELQRILLGLLWLIYQVTSKISR